MVPFEEIAAGGVATGLESQVGGLRLIEGISASELAVRPAEIRGLISGLVEDDWEIRARFDWNTLEST